MDRNRKKNQVLIILITITGVIIFLGSICYYGLVLIPKGISIPKCIAMSLQNTAETLLFNPTLTIADICSDIEFITRAHTAGYFIIFLYSLASIGAPVIDILIIFNILEEVFKSFAGVGFYNKKILIIGYNDIVKNILESGFKDSRVYLWNDINLTSEAEIDLYKKHVTVITNHFHITETEKQEKYANEYYKFLKRRKITHVLLMNESCVKNMNYYMILSDAPVCKERTIHFLLHNTDDDVSVFLEKYFDNKIEKINQNNDYVATKDTKCDLRLFNLFEIQSDILFNEMPFCNVVTNFNKPDIHMLIIGGGMMGEAILLKAMNNAVYSPDNRIVIDIVDKDICEIESRLRKKFNSTIMSFKKSEDGIVHIISDSKACDGNLEIRLVESDVQDDDFIDNIRKFHKSERYTYVVVTLPTEKDNLHCALIFDKIFDNENDNLNVAYRLPYSRQSKQNLIDSYNYCSDVFLMGTAEEYVGLDDIVNVYEEKNIRIFNQNYDMVTKKFIFDSYSESNPEQEWNNLKYYKRQSNRALYHHKKIKENMHIGAEDESRLFKEACANMEKNDINLSDELLRRDDNEYKYPVLVNWAKTEHRRWCLYFISEGWGFNQERDLDKKLHNCLCNWEELISNEQTRSYAIYDLISSPVFMKM